jgi:hypothetical protein
VRMIRISFTIRMKLNGKSHCLFPSFGACLLSRSIVEAPGVLDIEIDRTPISRLDLTIFLDSFLQSLALGIGSLSRNRVGNRPCTEPVASQILVLGWSYTCAHGNQVMRFGTWDMTCWWRPVRTSGCLTLVEFQMLSNSLNCNRSP